MLNELKEEFELFLSDKMIEKGKSQNEVIKKKLIQNIQNNRFSYTDTLKSISDIIKNDKIKFKTSGSKVKIIVAKCYLLGILQPIFDEQQKYKGYQLTKLYDTFLGFNAQTTDGYHYVLFNPVGQHVIQLVVHHGHPSLE